MSQIDDRLKFKADFGMSKNASEYSSMSALIPVRWSAPGIEQRFQS